MSFFEYVGIVVVGYAILRAAYRILNNVGTFLLGTGSVNFKSYGAWAVVTGCTDGIGKAYAEQLAKRGVNIVLISRTLAKLEEQAKEIREKYSVETKVIAVDFTEPDSIYPVIKSQLDGLDIGVLVNNVGMSYKHPEYFEVFGESNKNINDLIYCNVISLTKMTAIVLPNMVKKRQGIIINNSSASGRLPTPLLTVYSATKAYVDFFSQALNLEYKSKGIIVQSLCPYFVSTKLSAMRSSLMAPKPNDYVSNALNTITTQSVTNGCLIHNIQGWFFEEVIPRQFFNNLQFNHLSVSRSKAIAKAKKLEAQAKSQ